MLFRALDTNSYDNIAATYYLLAEAHVRETRECAAELPSCEKERLHKRRQHVRNSSTPERRQSLQHVRMDMSPLALGYVLQETLLAACL